MISMGSEPGITNANFKGILAGLYIVAYNQSILKWGRKLGHFVDDLAHLSFPKIPPEQTFNWRVDIKL